MSEKGSGNGHYTVADFLPHIEGSAGIISTIARRVGCDWHTARKYIDRYATLSRAYEDERQKTIDLAEITVLQAMKDGDVGTARWYLSTIGKGRGYVERQEVTGNEGNEIVVRFISNVDDGKL